MYSFLKNSLRFFVVAGTFAVTLPRVALAQVGVDPEAAIGEIVPPPGTEAYMKNTGNENQLLPFVSTLLTVGTVVAGVWVLLNIFLAAYTALTASGDSSAMDKVKNNITNSVIGLLLIVLSYTIAAIIGTIFFGDATLFIDPKF